MECKNCGNVIDMRSEKKFCSGCGAPITPEKKVVKGISHEHSTHYIPSSRREQELEIRSRAFTISSAAGFLLLFIVFEIVTLSFWLGFLLGLLSGPVVGVVFTAIVSRSNPNLKHAFNDFASVLPVWDKLKGFMESISSILPLFAPLPHD
jgi:hypothetical protein